MAHQLNYGPSTTLRPTSGRPTHSPAGPLYGLYFIDRTKLAWAVFAPAVPQLLVAEGSFSVYGGVAPGGEGPPPYELQAHMHELLAHKDHFRTFAGYFPVLRG